MASSASGQDEPNRALWLATRAGKMEPSCPHGTTRCIPHEKFPRKPYNKSFIDQVCSVKMAGYWPRSFFASSWTSTSSRLTTQKKKLANIQPSWPHTWSITHTYYMARQIRAFWLVLSWSGFRHTDRFRGNGHKLRIFCFRKPVNSKQAWRHIINYLLT